MCKLFLNQGFPQVSVGMTFSQESNSTPHLQRQACTIMNSNKKKEQTRPCYRVFLGREGTMGYLLHKSPKFYNDVFLFVTLTTFGNLTNFE